MSNPYDSPQGIEQQEADALWFPWPRIRRFLRPLVTIVVVVGILIFLLVVVGGRIESARDELRRTRTESMSRLRQPAGGSLSGSGSSGEGLSGNGPANQP